MDDTNAGQRQNAISKTKTSLERMQQFDTNKLPREDDLGKALNFKDAVEPANKLIGLYKQLSLDVLEAFPVQRLNSIKNQADSNFNQLDTILKFEPGTPKGQRDSLIQALYDAYDPAFEALAESISYSVRRSTDFEKLGRDARAVLQGVKDEAETIRGQLAASKAEADSTLEAIKKVAAEQGVSQQAIHFKTEGDAHGASARNWLIATVVMTTALAVYAVSTLFLHKSALLAPASVFESVQLTVSKVLIFGVLFYMLGLCAKNYLAHRHNTIVNKHRQNALATYTAIVKAANNPANSDIVLNKAADCIFTPQPSGYSKGEGAESGSTSFLTVGPNSVKPAVGGT